MPTNKTALEMLKDKVKQLKHENVGVSIYGQGYNASIDHVLLELQQLLPTERTQIEEAFDEGIQTSRMAADFARHPELKNKCKYTCFKGASDYFNKTFKDGE